MKTVHEVLNLLEAKLCTSSYMEWIYCLKDPQSASQIGLTSEDSEVIDEACRVIRGWM